MRQRNRALLKSKFRGIRQAQSHRNMQIAYVGKGDDTAPTADAPDGQVWVRKGSERGVPILVDSFATRADFPDMKVWIGENPDTERIEIVRLHGDTVQSAGAYASTLNTVIRNGDMLHGERVVMERLTNLKMYPFDGLTLGVESGYYLGTDGAWVAYGGGTVDLTAHVPSSADEKRIVLIGILYATNALTSEAVATVSLYTAPRADENIKLFEPSDIVTALNAASTTGVYWIGALPLVTGQTHLKWIDQYTQFNLTALRNYQNVTTVAVNDVLQTQRSVLNFLDGNGVNISGADDSGNDETELTFAVNEGEIDHAQILNIGTNSHVVIDAHIASTANPHTVTAAQVGNSTAQWNADQLQGVDVDTTAPTNLQALLYDSGNAWWEPATISHLNISNIGTNTHVQIDSHIASTSNPHSVTAAQALAVALAGDTMTGALVIDGSSDTPQLTVQGHSTQSSNLVVLENSAGIDQITLANDGSAIFNVANNAVNFTVKSDTASNAIIVNGTQETVGIYATPAVNIGSFEVGGQFIRNTSGQARGVLLAPDIESTIAAIGGVGYAPVIRPGVAGSAYGTIGTVKVHPTAGGTSYNINPMFGTFIRVDFNAGYSGAVASLYNQYIAAPTAGGASMSNLWGIYIQPSTMPSSNYRGIEIAVADNSATNSYNIYASGTASNYFKGPVYLVPMTTTTRNGYSAKNGMLIYNSSDNKFQGYQGGTWTNLA